MRATASRLGWPLAAAASAGLACLARYGYTFGIGDHFVLMPKGLSLSDPGAFRNDWFVHQVPQPHWLFDLVTSWGAQLGVLPVVYVLYWLCALAAFGTAAVWLTRRFLPGRPWPAVLLGPVVAAGPEKILGSTTPLLGVALPHVLGGCLAFLVLAALLNGYWRTVLVGSVLTGLVHVQHGVNLAPVLLLAAVLATGVPRRTRLGLAGTGGLLVAGAAVVSQVRQIDSAGTGWLEICQSVIPFHCDANSWTAGYLASGGLVVALALLLVVAHRSAWRTLIPAVALPATGLVLAVAADRLDVPVVAHLVQAANAYRLSALVVPFAAFGVLLLAAGQRSAPLAARLALAAVVIVWLTGGDGPFLMSRSSPLVLVLLVAALVVVLPIGVRTRDRAETTRRTEIPGTSRWPVPPGLLAVAMVVMVILAGQGYQPPIRASYDRQVPEEAAALDLGSRLPEGSVVAAAPSIGPILALSGRAVIADCKRVPYGGRHWEQYKARITALGGRVCRSEDGFEALPVGGVEALSGRFGATHVLLTGHDPKLSYALEHWRRVWRSAPDTDAVLAGGWSVFELPS